MWFIFDEQQQAAMKRVPSGDAFGSLFQQNLALSSLAILIKDDTYVILKNRYNDDTGIYPIEDLGEDLKSILANELRRVHDIAAD